MCLSDILQTSHTPNCGDEPSAFIIYPRKLSAMNGIWPGGDSFVILQPHFISHLFMRGTVRKISLLMTVVFAIFVCGNTLFIHTHSENGQTVTHSHPYLPGQAHHHSANAFQCIGGANAATFSMLPSGRDELRRFRTQIYGTDRPAVREKLRCI